MRATIVEKCCDICDSYLRDVNKGGTEKIVSISVITSEKAEINHVKNKYNKCQKLLKAIQNDWDVRNENGTDKALRTQETKRTKSNLDMEKSLTQAEDSTINLIVMVMRQNIESVEAQIRGCHAIWSVSFVDKRATAGSKYTSDAVDAILEAMKYHAEVSLLIEQACETLSQLAFLCEKTSTKIIEAGGIHVIANTMKKHFTLVTVQEKACSALCNLLFYEKSYEAVNVGGILVPELVTAMQLYPHNEELQVKACCAFRNLSGIHDSKVVDAITNNEGINIVMEAMVNHPHNPELQSQACGALSNLSIDKYSSRKVMLDSGCVKQLGKTVRDHQNDSRVVASAFRALANMCNTEDLTRQGCDTGRCEPYVNIDIRNSIVEAGTIQLVVNAMEKHPNQANLQETACLLLRNLSFNTNAMEILAEEVPIPLLNDAMENFPKECRENVLKVSGRVKFASRFL